MRPAGIYHDHPYVLRGSEFIVLVLASCVAENDPSCKYNLIEREHDAHARSADLDSEWLH